MVPDYDDDDVIEDYEEVPSESGVRRVNSAQGGPVQRPAGGARPSTTAMQALPDGQLPPKGKITQKSAKLIWIVCILIVVLGVGAVLVDMIFDPLGRKNSGGGDVANNAPTSNRSGLPPQNNRSPREELEAEFKTAVVTHYKQFDSSKVWDLYWTAFLEFDKSYDDAVELKKKEGTSTEDLEAAWANTITHWYKVRYYAELFRNHNDHNDASLEFFVINIDNKNELESLQDDQLKNKDIRLYQAAATKIDSRSSKVNKFQTDVIKYDLVAGQVFNSKEWEEKTFGEYKQKWGTAVSDKQFAQEDLDIANSPDYKAGEDTMAKKWLEANGGS